MQYDIGLHSSQEEKKRLVLYIKLNLSKDKCVMIMCWFLFYFNQYEYDNVLVKQTKYILRSLTSDLDISTLFSTNLKRVRLLVHHLVYTKRTPRCVGVNPTQIIGTV